MTNFEQYLKNLMGMKKAEIINEGITWGIWANTEGNKAELMKWKKVLLARSLADRLERLERAGLLRQGRKPLFFYIWHYVHNSVDFFYFMLDKHK